MTVFSVHRRNPTDDILATRSHLKLHATRHWIHSQTTVSRGLLKALTVNSTQHGINQHQRVVNPFSSSSGPPTPPASQTIRSMVNCSYLPLLCSQAADGDIALGQILSAPATIVGTACCVVSLATILWTLKSPSADVRKSPRKIHELPSRLPILGTLLDLLKNFDRRLDWITSLCLEYKGEPIAFQIPGQPREITICSVQGVEDILKNQFASFPKGSVMCENFRDILGHGIFAVDGPQWVHQRKTVSHLFTHRELRDNMSECMRHHTVLLQRILQKASEDGTTLDWFKLMNRFTIETFAKMAFGADIQCLEAAEDHPFQAAFDSAQRLILERFMRPTWLWKLMRYMNIGFEAQLQKDIAVIDETVLKIIAQSLTRREKSQQAGGNNHTAKDIISLFLDDVDATGQPFEPKLLRDIIVNFLIAGRDSTAQAMSWFFYNVSLKPSVAEKIRTEIALLIPDLSTGKISSPTMEDVHKLTYLEAALKETLRLHPSVPIIPKVAAEDTLLSDGTLIPKGARVGIPVYSMARMPFIWGDDAAELSLSGGLTRRRANSSRSRLPSLSRSTRGRGCAWA